MSIIFHDSTEQDDHRDVHGVRVEKMRRGEVTEEDMLHKLLEHEEHGHEEDSRGLFFIGKGNRSLPWSDGEEWEFGESGSGGFEDMRGPGRSEDWRRPGSGSGSRSRREMPVRRVGVVEFVFLRVFKQLCVADW